MDYKILWDNNILLDLFLLRTKDNPYIKEIETLFVQRKIPVYLSSSQLHNIKFILSKHLQKANINISANEIIKKFLDTHIVKILKTPSYIDLNLWTTNFDIEDELIRLSAETFDAWVLTRDENFLKRLGEKGIHPGNFKNFLNSFDKKTIPMLDLTTETLYQYNNIEKSIDEVIKKSQFILGDAVKEFEKRLSNYIGTKYAVGVSSGTDALLLSLRALAIKRKGQEYWSKDDLVITTPFTFTATGDTILRSGANPLFVDIDLDTYNIDVQKVKEAIKQCRKRVVGIVPVHLYGLPCNMDEIMMVAQENKLFVVEDCAQAFGSMYKGKKVGSFGDTGAFSFFPTKNLGAFGDAGAITTNDEEIYELIKMLRVHGGKDKYNVEHIGYKARIDTIQAAILLEKINYIDEFNQKRRKIAENYMSSLSDIRGLKLPYIPSEDYYHTFHQFTIFVKEGKRDELQRSLKENNIQSMVYYPTPLHKMKVFEGRCKVFGSLENSEKASEGVLSLPIEPLMEKEEVDRVKFIIVNNLGERNVIYG